MAQARGKVTIDTEECKAAAFAWTPARPNAGAFARPESYGVHPARYTGMNCSGCGICFYVCPEPGAITVYRLNRAQGGSAA